jgi:hypothetical protein
MPIGDNSRGDLIFNIDIRELFLTYFRKIFSILRKLSSCMRYSTIIFDNTHKYENEIHTIFRHNQLIYRHDKKYYKCRTSLKKIKEFQALVQCEVQYRSPNEVNEKGLFAIYIHSDKYLKQHNVSFKPQEIYYQNIQDKLIIESKQHGTQSTIPKYAIDNIHRSY